MVTIFACSPASDSEVENAPVEDAAAPEAAEEGEAIREDPASVVKNPDLAAAREAMMECESAYMRMERELMIKDSIISVLRAQ